MSNVSYFIQALSPPGTATKEPSNVSVGGINSLGAVVARPPFLIQAAVLWDKRRAMACG